MLPALVLAFLCASSWATAQGMSSAHYSIPKLVENNGSGTRSSATYQITGDTISPQPVETSVSTNHTLQGRPLVTVPDSTLPSCGIYINDNATLTSSIDVDLSLLCGHASGCVSMQFSNNGVGWSVSQAYATTAPWTLVANDGTRKVFAKFQNGLGNWSGACYDEIVLDTKAPSVTISPTGGTYMETQHVAITASEPAVITYTTDGSDPTTSPTALTYTGPVAISADGTLRTFATDVAGNQGAVASETYEICNGSGLSISGIVMDATRNKPMPLVVVTLSNGQSATSDLTTGAYAFTGLPRGWYEIVSVTTPVAGFVTYQSTFTLCKTSITHDIVLTRDATVFGKDTNSGYSSEGVNTSTGNYAYKVVDLAFPGVGPSFVFERAYNSQDGTNGPLGYGWTWNYNVSLSDGPGGELVMRWGDGKTEVWEPDGVNWKPMYGVFSTLIESPDNVFTLRRKDLVEFRFDIDRKLTAVVDEFGNAITFTYSGSNLTSITETAGRAVTLSYDASDRITNVLDPIGRSASFAYDASGNLITAVNLEGGITRYTYDASHEMLTITDPKGNVALTNTYDETRGVVVSQRDAVGGETRYTYDVPSRTTTILDALGHTSKHQFDDRLRLVREEDALGNAASFVFDERGTMTSATDKNGNVTTYVYDANGNVLEKTEPLGRVTSATYDAANNPLTKTDARGHAQVFEYDPLTNNLTASYACGEVPAASCAGDPSVRKTVYTYDGDTGKLLTVTDAAGTALERTTTYQYDVFGNQVAVIDALGNTSTFTYDGVGRKLTETHPLGRAVAYEYDAMDRLLSVTDALGGQAQYAYDANGNKTGHLDANLHWTNFAYDAADRLTSTTDALGNVERYGYDSLGRRTEVTNARGAVSQVAYDAVGNVTHEIDALGNAVRFEHDANGNRTTAWDAKGYASTSTYDALDRLVEVEDPLGNTESYEYDLNGNRTKVTDALGKETVSTYDALDRLATVTDPEGNTVTNTYDLLGRLVKVRDARGNETHFEYDALDRLVQVTDPEAGFVTAGYDALGNRTRVTDPRGHDTTYAYDVLNRLTQETDPLGNAVVMTYDAVGNLKTLVNADGTSTYAYDAVNRVTDLTYPDLTTVAYTYDANGNRTRVEDAAGVTAYTYDSLDRIASVTDPFGLTVAYTYDQNGNRSSTRYPGNRSVIYLFDELDRLVRVQDWGGVATTYAYDDAGRLASQAMGNGAVVTYAYDDAGRLVTKEDRAAGGAVIASTTYTLDPNGNRTGMATVQPTYPDVDLLDHLYAHNDGNQVTSNNGTTYTYDGKGNRETATTGGVTTQYAYDYNNRLTSVSDGASLWQYRYTSDGKRISSTVDGVETRWLLDLNGGMEFVLAELTAANAVKRYYVYGDGLLYSVDGTTGERLFYHYDPLGSTVALTDLTGNVTDSYAYLPYGEPAGSAGPDENPFTYVGKLGVMRESNGLYFMRARYYDALARVFLSRDTIAISIASAESLNKYNYASRNPLKSVDPAGYFSIDTFVNVAYAATTALGIAGAADSADTAVKTPTWDRVVGAVAGIVGAVDSIASIGAAKLNPATGLAVEGINFCLGVYQGASGQQYERNFSGGNVIGYLVGAGLERATWGIRYKLLDLKMRAEWAIDDLISRLDVPLDQSSPTAGLGKRLGNFGAAGNQLVSGNNGAGTSTAGPSVGDSGAAGAPSSEVGQPGQLQQSRPPKKYLSVKGFATSYFKKEFQLILDPDFLDNQTRSAIEQAISYQIADLSMNTYSYRQGDSKGKRRAKEQRAADVAGAGAQLYTQLVSALSKHEVIIRSLSALPSGAQGGIVTGGVYGGR